MATPVLCHAMLTRHGKRKPGGKLFTCMDQSFGGFVNMGRAKSSEEERRKTVTNFIRTTRELINSDGIGHVSIRKISAKSSCASATIYHYFKNADELIDLACISYLERYCRALASDMPTLKDPLDIYMHTWELFCRYAFTYPQVFYHLFFKCKASLKGAIDTYYELYPQQLVDISGSIYDMLKSGTLKDRCEAVLIPVAKAGIIDLNELDVINDMSICYFRELLENLCARPHVDLSTEYTDKFMRALRILLKLRQS